MRGCIRRSGLPFSKILDQIFSALRAGDHRISAEFIMCRRACARLSSRRHFVVTSDLQINCAVFLFESVVRFSVLKMGWRMSRGRSDLEAAG